MRVAVTCPADHPVSPGAKFAYRLGRIQDGVHNVMAHLDTPVPLEEFVNALVEKAKAEFPGFEVAVERLVEDGAGASKWVPADEVQDQAPAPAGDTTQATTIGVTAEAGAA